MNRLITGLIASLVWVGTLYIQSYILLWFFVFAIALIGLYEYFKMCLPQSDVYTRLAVLIVSSLPILSIYQTSPHYLVPSILLASFIFIILSITLPTNSDIPKDIFITKSILALVLISLCSTFVPLLVTLEDGFLWLGLLTTMTIASDTGAYYTGSNFGKNKLCPQISPGKTIEGLLGGLLCCMFFSWIYKILFLQNQSTTKILILAFIICLIGVCGDLTESIIKRANNTKDSGTVLPGHGGILDRIDSILASAPALYYSISLGFMY